MTNDRTLRGIVFALIGFLLFSIGDVIAKILRQGGYSPFQISFFYALAAGIFLLACSQKLGGLASTLRTSQRKWHLLRAVLAAPTQALVFFAISRMPLSNAYSVVFLAPFLTDVFAVPLLKERIAKLHWLLILTGFIGVLVAMRPNVNGLGAPTLAVLAVAVFAAGRNVIVRKMGSQETPLSLALYPTIAIMLAMSLPAWWTRMPMSWTVALLLMIGGIAFGTGLLLTSLSFRYAPTEIAAPFHYSQILWGVLAGVLFFGNAPDRWILVGCAIIVASDLVLIRVRKPAATPPLTLPPTIPLL